MINREIPFRPRLEGEFRVRFYNAASEITEKTPTLTIARIAEREIGWVENDCQYNIEQRKKYRAVWFLFRDLIRASWKACYRDGVLYMSLPTLNGADMHDTTSPEVKALLRSWMSESRHERLVSYTDFINRMENPGANKQSIASLIADGAELAERMELAHTGAIEIEQAIQPYLQLVRENDRDVFSGKGDLFDAIRNAIDPVAISHPTWDERILLNDIPDDSWVDGYEIPAEAIAYDNYELFKLRKRQFYFFNKNGEELLKIMDDDVTRFQEFLGQDNGKIIKELVRKLNTFFGAVKASNSELQIWTGHRYDNEPRKVLISIGSIKKSGLKIGRPALLKGMKSGIDMTASYIRLEKRDAAHIFLKIDFDMYMPLNIAEALFYLIWRKLIV